MNFRWRVASQIVAAWLGWATFFGQAAVIEVGPGWAVATPGAVAWESLQAGDVVRIHWRSNAYQDKWVICRQGTAEAPIVVQGVPGPGGELPVIDGSGAATRPALNYWNQERGVLKIGGANVPPDTTPRYIVIEHLELRSARPPYGYTAANGSPVDYPNNAAGLYVEKGEHLVIRGCVFRDCGNGLFIAAQSRDVLVEGNHLFDNGNVGSAYEHSSYTAAHGITFQYNRYGPLREGCNGNSLKDRSAGLVVRYNWIESGNRQLDLVDGEDSAEIQNDPLYRRTLVYGNVLIEPDGAGNSQIVHYGGDSGNTAIYRKGVLHFYHNTVISTRSGNTTLFRLSTNEERCDARNNLFFVTASGNRLALVDSTGLLNLTHNWLKTGFVPSHNGTPAGALTNDGSNLTGSAPGFLSDAQQNFRLAAPSTCRDAGIGLHPDVPAEHAVVRHYVPHRASEARRMFQAPDLGAFEFSPYQAWRFEQFGVDWAVDAVSGDDADPDLDGVPNLIEYAFLSSPRIAGGLDRPVGERMVVGTGAHLALRFPRRPPPSDLAYVVQVSDDLTDWSVGSRYADDASTADTALTVEASAGPPTVVRLAAPVSAAPQQFLRVVVDRP